MGKEDKFEMKGTVIEPLPGTRFKVELENKSIIEAHLGGRLRTNHIRILPGDEVTVELSAYDPTKGRITYRNTGKRS